MHPSKWQPVRGVDVQYHYYAHPAYDYTQPEHLIKHPPPVFIIEEGGLHTLWAYRGDATVGAGWMFVGAFFALVEAQITGEAIAPFYDTR